MVKTVHGKERNEILPIFNSDPSVNILDVKNYLDKSDSVIIYKDDSGRICGCATLWLWGENKNKADAYIYVIPQMRRNGIGKTLLQELLNLSRQNMFEFISSKIETNHEQSLAFFRKAGFGKWYTELFLYHSGERQPESGLRFINYSSEYFTQYINAIRDSFYELRKANNFQPYYCCEPNEEKKRELEEKKNDIFLLMDGSNIVASVLVNTDSIDDVFVIPVYQGKGIGKKLMQFAVNTAIDRKSNPIKLSAIEWNSRALHIYESIGFHINSTVTYMRLFL